jgi:hypothetical protein
MLGGVVLGVVVAASGAARGFEGPTAVEAAESPGVASSSTSSSTTAPTSTTTATRSPERAPRRERRSLKIPALRLQRATVSPWVRSTTFVEWYRDNYNPQTSDDGFVSLVQRLNVGTDTRTRALTVSAQARIDAQKIWFTAPRDCVGDCVDVGDDARLERATLRLDARRWGLQLGDFNVGFGRGLGLSVRKIDEIGVDATIKGARADVRTDVVRGTVVAGFANRQNSDFATRQLVADPGYPAQSYTFAPDTERGFCNRARSLDPELGSPLWTTCSDLVAGGRVEATLPGRVDVGTHYAYIDFGDELTAGVVDEYLHRFGGDVGRARIGGIWDLYFGATGQLRNPNLEATELRSQARRGWGLYGNSTVLAGTTTVLLEGKHYRDDLVALSQASPLQYAENPTLEREDQQVPGNASSTGGRVRVDHTWRRQGLTVFGNAMVYAYADTIGRHPFEDDGRIATHHYGGVIYRKPRSDLVVQLSGGYRDERFLHDHGYGSLKRKFPHGEVSVSIPLGHSGNLTHQLTVRAEARWETYVTQGASDRFFRGIGSVAYSLSPRLSIAFIQGVDSQQPAPAGEASLSRETCTAGSASTCRPHLWPGAQLQVLLFDASFIRIFAGRQVGGRVCVNGSCRTLPDFEGVRTELVFSF